MKPLQHLGEREGVGRVRMAGRIWGPSSTGVDGSVRQENRAGWRENKATKAH